MRTTSGSSFFFFFLGPIALETSETNNKTRLIHPNIRSYQMIKLVRNTAQDRMWLQRDMSPSIIFYFPQGRVALQPPLVFTQLRCVKRERGCEMRVMGSTGERARLRVALSWLPSTLFFVWTISWVNSRSDISRLIWMIGSQSVVRPPFQVMTHLSQQRSTGSGSRTRGQKKKEKKNSQVSPGPLNVIFIASGFKLLLWHRGHLMFFWTTKTWHDCQRRSGLPQRQKTGKSESEALQKKKKKESKNNDITTTRIENKFFCSANKTKMI